MTGLPAFSLEQHQAFSGILARAQTDASFRSRLLDQPNAVLADADIAVPARIDLRVLDCAPGVAYVVLPRPPAEGEVTDNDLATASGGTTPAVVIATFIVTMSILVTNVLSTDDI